MTTTAGKAVFSNRARELRLISCLQHYTPAIFTQGTHSTLLVSFFFCFLESLAWSLYTRSGFAQHHLTRTLELGKEPGLWTRRSLEEFLVSWAFESDITNHLAEAFI